MTDLKKLSEEMAEEYGQKCADDGSISPHTSFYDGKNGFLAGFQSCLDLLAKQSGDFATVFVYKVDLSNGNKTCSLFKKLEYIAPEWKPQFVKFIDHAALLSANAKIAQLEEELLSSKANAQILDEMYNICCKDRISLEKDKLELQQRVKELESEEKALQTIAKDAVVAANKSLEAFTICDAKYVEACGKIKELEQELVRIKSIVKNYEKRLSNYECHHGYRKDQACISSNCDVANHTKEKL